MARNKDGAHLTVHEVTINGDLGTISDWKDAVERLRQSATS
jgi:hypothetical protein